MLRRRVRTFLLLLARFYITAISTATLASIPRTEAQMRMRKGYLVMGWLAGALACRKIVPVSASIAAPLPCPLTIARGVICTLPSTAGFSNSS